MKMDGWDNGSMLQHYLHQRWVPDEGRPTCLRAKSHPRVHNPYELGALEILTRTTDFHVGVLCYIIQMPQLKITLLNNHLKTCIV